MTSNQLGRTCVIRESTPEKAKMDVSQGIYPCLEILVLYGGVLMVYEPALGATNLAEALLSLQQKPAQDVLASLAQNC
jgi:hypothetical protein